uniref:Syntaxin-16 n=1 Tax=Culex pipiens TaxID=7175 RepID=A0A8D8H5C5_CULPI
MLKTCFININIYLKKIHVSLYSNRFKANLQTVGLLDRQSGESSNFIEQPTWICKYDEAQYLLSKIKSRVNDLLRVQNSTARSVLSESREDELKVQEYAKDIYKLIGTCHSNVKSLSSSTKANNRLEIILLQNVEKNLLMALQHITDRFRQNQTAFIDEQNNMEQKSKIFFDNISTNIESIGNNVDTFDNFLNMDVPSSSSSRGGAYSANDDDDRLDEYFQLPASGLSINQKQLMLIEADNTKMIQSREQEVNTIVNKIVDLNTIFKDLAHLVQEQGTILDRIDYNVESTQTRVFEGYKQLQTAEKYQRKNRKIYCIVLLAGMIMFMIILIIFTKF